MEFVKIFLTSILLLGCNQVNENQNYTFPSSEIPSYPVDQPTTPSTPATGFQLVDSKLFGYSTMGGGGGLSAMQLVYDGTNLVLPSVIAADTIQFGLINSSNLAAITSYNATAAGVYEIYSATSNSAGNISILYKHTNGTKYISTWPTTNPTTPLTTVTFNPSTFGCHTSINDFKITLKNTTYYGACTPASGPSGQLRLFSMDISGNLLSAVTVSWPGSNLFPVRGLFTKDNLLWIAADTSDTPSGTTLFKYDLSFQYIGKLNGSLGSLANLYQSVNAIIFVGTTLFINNGGETCSGYSTCYRITKLTHNEF